MRILTGAVVVLVALCAIVALRVMHGIRPSPKPAEQTTFPAPPVEVKPALAATIPSRVLAKAPSAHSRPQSDSGKQHKKVTVEHILTDEDFKRLPVRLSDLHGDGLWFPRKWGADFATIDRRDLDQAGSWERALGRVPGIVFRQTDPP